MRRTKHVQGKGGEGGKENGKREMEKEGTRATFGDGWRETTNERENEREGARIGKEVRDKEMAKERTNASGRWMERSGNEGNTRKLSRALGGACPRRTLGMKKDRGFLQQRIRHVLDRKDTLRTRMKRVNHLNSTLRNARFQHASFPRLEGVGHSKACHSRPIPLAWTPTTIKLVYVIGPRRNGNAYRSSNSIPL